RTLDRIDPLRRVGGAHGREDAVQVGLAHEQHALFGQVDREVAAGVRAPEEEHLDALVADAERELVVDQHGRETGGGASGTGGGGRHHLGGGGVRDEGGALGEGAVAGRVVAVIGADDHVRD